MTDDADDYADDWDDLTEKEILIGCLTELQQIRMALTDGQAVSEGDDDPAMYRCRQCTATVQADERERHAMQQHKAPADMVEQMFEEQA